MPRTSAPHDGCPRAVAANRAPGVVGLQLKRLAVHHQATPPAHQRIRCTLRHSPRQTGTRDSTLLKRPNPTATPCWATADVRKRAPDEAGAARAVPQVLVQLLRRARRRCHGTTLAVLLNRCIVPGRAWPVAGGRGRHAPRAAAASAGRFGRRREAQRKVELRLARVDGAPVPAAEHAQRHTNTTRGERTHHVRGRRAAPQHTIDAFPLIPSGACHSHLQRVNRTPAERGGTGGIEATAVWNGPRRRHPIRHATNSLGEALQQAQRHRLCRRPAGGEEQTPPLAPRHKLTRGSPPAGAAPPPLPPAGWW